MNSKQEYYRTPRGEMAGFLPDNAMRVIEIGCGEGAFFEHFNKDAEIWGVEPDEFSADIAQKKAFKLFQSDYHASASLIPDNYFDLIVCNDVIEHVVDYLRMLESLRTKLNARGRIIASVPNVRFYTNLKRLLWAGDWQYKDSGILDRTHMRFFTKKSLQRTFLETGYNVESCVGINSLLDRRLDPLPALEKLFLKSLLKWPRDRFSGIEFTQFAIVATVGE
jgi:2-polyprenyl-3-methyl-5-hydroxy-6-metoxy-1,4-benzoquinol methylase